jgi:hypothetical protein
MWFSYLLNRRRMCISMLVPMPPGGVGHVETVTGV